MRWVDKAKVKVKLINKILICFNPSEWNISSQLHKIIKDINKNL